MGGGLAERADGRNGASCMGGSPPGRPGFPPALRLPMTEANEASRAAVDAALAHAGLA